LNNPATGDHAGCRPFYKQMEYWIIVDKRHAGPYSADQLVNAGLKPDTLIWCEGLPEWTPAGQISELAQMMAMRDQAANRAETENAYDPQARQYEREQSVTENASYGNSSADSAPQQQTANSDTTASRTQPSPCAAPYAAITDEPCPPAYIAWSVIATLLCCTIAGIPAIIFSSMTKSAYYKGNIEKARKYSEWAQWCIILAITLGAVSWPFQLAFMGSF